MTLALWRRSKWCVGASAGYGSERSLQGVEVVGGVPHRTRRSSLVVLPDIKQAVADEAPESATSTSPDPQPRESPATHRPVRYRTPLPQATAHSPPAYRPRDRCERPISSL